MPVVESLRSVLQYESVRQQVHVHKPPTRLPDTLEDIWDGSNVAENALFQSDPKSLGLILYQDAFEVANPLGSGKKKQSSCGVFLLTSADSVILIVKLSPPLPWQKPHSGQLNHTMTMCSSWVHQTLSHLQESNLIQNSMICPFSMYANLVCLHA